MGVAFLALAVGCSPAFVDVSGRPAIGDTGQGIGPDSTGDTAGDTGGDTARDTSGGTDTAWAPLEVCVNEFMPETVAAVLSDAGEASDWIELHNPGAVEVSLSGWALTNEQDDPFRSTLPEGLVLPAGGFLVLWADQGVAIGERHLNFSLDADGGEVGLHAPDGRGAIVTYGAVAEDFSVARQPDCCTDAGCFAFDYRGTPGASNGGAARAGAPGAGVTGEDTSAGSASTAQIRHPAGSSSRR